MMDQHHRLGEKVVVADWRSSPVRRATNSVASEYMKRRWLKSRVTQWDHRMTRAVLLEELKPGPGERILEIGCGPGTWTKEVAPFCQEVVAVDISEGMIAEARNNAQGLPVRFVHSDFLSAQLEGKWDKIFSALAIEYIPDRAALARKICEHLAPGGTVVLITKTRFSVWRGRMRLMYDVAPFSWVTGRGGPNGTRAGYGKRRRNEVQQYLSSPGQLVAAFAPFGVAPVKVRPVVIRLPLFQQGFHEISLIPECLAQPFLGLSSLLFTMSSHVGIKLAFLPLLLCESYAITLQRTDGDKGSRLEESQD